MFYSIPDAGGGGRGGGGTWAGDIGTNPGCPALCYVLPCRKCQCLEGAEVLEEVCKLGFAIVD